MACLCYAQDKFVNAVYDSVQSVTRPFRPLANVSDSLTSRQGTCAIRGRLDDQKYIQPNYLIGKKSIDSIFLLPWTNFKIAAPGFQLNNVENVTLDSALFRVRSHSLFYDSKFSSWQKPDRNSLNDIVRKSEIKSNALATEKLPNVTIDGNGIFDNDKEFNEVKKRKNELNDISANAAELQDLTHRSDSLGNTGEKALTSRGEEYIRDEINDLDQGTSKVEELRGKVNGLNAQNGDSLINEVKNEFIDHFKGKEEVIKNDLERVGKIQLKYKNFSDSRTLPKRPPNEMKGKSFRQRLLPGLGFNVVPSGDFSMDLFPFIGYRLTGHLTAGLGGYKRILYTHTDGAISGTGHYGIRIFAAYKVIKGIHGYAEFEYFNGPSGKERYINRPGVISENIKFNLGVQKRYPITRRLYGLVIVMYDLTKLKYFPNSEGANARFGVDYQLKKKKNKNA